MLCKSPRTYKTTAGGLLPCGQCKPCKINRRRDWTTRLVLESKSHARNLWLTLTYNHQTLPMSLMHPRLGRTFGSEDFPTLWREDYQNFFKRLRSYDVPDFKFFISGEYGEQYHRPHYHVCLFGLDNSFRNAILSAWSYRDNHYKQQPIGNVFFGDLNWDTCQYTCGYTLKKMTSFDHEDLYGRYPEFGQGSKGLALLAVEDIIKYMDKHRLNQVPTVLYMNGKQIPVPRYMKAKLYAHYQVSKEEQQAQWQEDMLLMRYRARNSKTAPSIERLYEEENRQSLLNQDARLKLFYEKEKLL